MRLNRAVLYGQAIAGGVRNGSMKIFRYALILGLGQIALLTVSCKSRPASPPVQYPPPVATAPTPQPPPIQPAPPAGTPRIETPSTRIETPAAKGIPRWIRIGLATDVRTVRISSLGEVDIENLLDTTQSSNGAEGSVTFTLRSAPGESHPLVETPPSQEPKDGQIFRIQIASLRDSDRAKSLKQEIESRLKVPAIVSYNESGGTYRVRVGECYSRVEAEELGERLQDAGYAEGWIVSEEGVSRASKTSTPRPPERSFITPTLEVQNGKEEELIGWPLPEGRRGPISLVRISSRDPRNYLSFDKLSYRGSIELVENTRGKLNVVNVVELEDYLNGVVPNEMPPSKFDAIEALKAQAVAARTYALKNEGRFLSEGYQLCATIACQVYRGVASERPLSTQAVEATRGIVIKYHGELIDSLYTSTCGGHTEDAKNIFQSMDTPYLRSASCPPENAPEIDPRLVEVSGYHLKWTVHVTRAELERTLRKTLPLDELVDLEPLKYGVSNRVIELQVKGRKRDFILKGLEVKSALGLKDSLFILDREFDRRGRVEAFDFIGRGWGHGVGLCQTGAYGLAREGKPFESILKTYYYDVDVVQENFREN